jgi:GntR family transcriptional regulator, transcriptional repressor for pyruvate dehydrogenase complex
MGVMIRPANSSTGERNPKLDARSRKAGSGTTGQTRTLGPARKPRVFEQICDAIRLRVAAGELRPGDKLPAERELSASFGVSRSAVREALRSLEIAGVVKLQKGVKGGAFVLRGDPDLITRSIRDMFYLGRISIDSLTEARVLILELAVRLASERISPDTVEALGRNIDQLGDLRIDAPTPERIAIGLDFYRLLAEATGNRLLQVIIVALSTIVLQLSERHDMRPLPGLVATRRRLVAHISNGDGTAAGREITDHLRRLHTHLVREIKRHNAENGESGLVAAVGTD